MFFAPWCGHCKRLHPTWNDLGKKYNTEESTTAIGKVDCTQHTALCSSQDVTGYPTLKFFAKGTEGGVKYRGPRDLASLEKFMAEQLGTDEPESDKPVDTPGAVSGLVQYTDATFKSATSKGKHFVKFYAPWCGHCQRMAPTWDALARSYEHETSVTIGKVDCTQHKEACQEYEVKGYPTLIWIEEGKKVEKYSGDRSHEDLKSFVSRLLGVATEGDEKEEEKEEQRSPVVVLTADNFESTTATGLTFIKFYAPWCGHCKRMAPTFDALGRRFVGHEKVKIAKVDCTQEVNRELCREQQVNGFPTVFLYNTGSRMAEYMGDRSLEDMVSFITSRLGTGKDEL